MRGLLLASLASGTALSAVASSAAHVLPAGWLWQLADVLVSMAFLTVLFAAMFRYIPVCRAAWSDVLPAVYGYWSAVTSSPRARA